MSELFTKYFNDLANNNQDNYNELLSFSKQFITGQLKDNYVYNLVGSGYNGKTTLLTILLDLNSDLVTMLNVYNIPIDMIVLEEQYGFNYNNIVTPIVITSNVTLYYPNKIMKRIDMNNTFFYINRNENIKNELLGHKNELIDFILKFDIK